MSNDNALSQAKAQANNIAAMVAALNVDYDLLEELRDVLTSLRNDVADIDVSEELHAEAVESLKDWQSSYSEELAELEEAANGCKDSDEARERIQEDALEVQVREGWKSPGEDSTPSEFQILLCTGGPAVRIMGELDDNMQPYRAWIEYQDWGTPWTMLDSMYVEQSTLLEYCQQFYFGE